MAEVKLAAPKKGAKKSVTPSKNTMNFVHHESSFNVKKLIPVIGVIVVIAAVGVKFGFLDQLDKKTRKYNELADRQSIFASFEAALSDYNKTEEEYGKYSYGWMAEEETAIVDREQIMELLEETVQSRAGIKSIAINSNAVTLNLHGLTLEQAGTIVAELEESPIVNSAAIQNIKSVDDDLTEVTMSVVFAKEVPEE